jgi:hypothetical protein
MLLLRFSKSCIQLEWTEIEQISCGSSPKKVCSRAAFFGRSMALDKILTLNNLRKRHVIVIDRCHLCKKSSESVDHLLHCDVGSTLWSSLFSHFRLSWVMPRRVIDLLACW